MMILTGNSRRTASQMTSKTPKFPIDDNNINAAFNAISKKLEEIKTAFGQAFPRPSTTLPGLDEPMTPVTMTDLFPPQLMQVYIGDLGTKKGVVVTHITNDSTEEVSLVINDISTPEPTSSTVSVDLTSARPKFEAIDHFADQIESLKAEVKEDQLTRKLKRVASRTQKSAIIAPQKPAPTAANIKLTDDKDIEKRRKAREKHITDLLDSDKKRHISSSSV